MIRTEKGPKSGPFFIDADSESNKRTIYKYIHENGIQSCQLMMGMTLLEPNNMWNTMPAHVHDRRMGVYLYFDLDEKARVFHFRGEPNETRHIVMKNEQVVFANYAIALSLFGIIERPVLVFRQTCSALVKGKAS
ncbi:hypothetical protein AS030_20500 [Fictibacillus enclensis]|uniref:5-dehydro-4-deoxy-D-glucuronate isomerase n=1 Tax=Fictibacillus enclensis TaxID=1017270 RepID=A0A0V8IZR3_9BACL|nr:hypothetical protein AS030_20500 [Fictibacillus enclensis]